MFDAYARSLLIDVPELDGLTGDAVARALSGAYLSLIHYRTSGLTAVDDLGPTLAFLRRLANALLFEIILDENRHDQGRRAAAFVAAESLALQADFIAATAEHAEDINEVFRAERMARVESALLYLYAQYDACAAGVLTLGSPPASLDRGIEERAASWCFARLEALCRLRLDSESVLHKKSGCKFGKSHRLDPQGLEQDTLSRLYVELGIVAGEFAEWLLGAQHGRDEAMVRLDRLRSALAGSVPNGSGARLGHGYARVYHLATLLNLTLPALANRALCHTVPPPPESDWDQYARYLTARARGTKDTPGRALLWPSAAEYVRQCVTGDTVHAVVSMPTGSGKSFLAELAVSQALDKGWVLYLAPTNALCEQIRGDLRQGLATLDTEILAFIGDQEYSVFGTDIVAEMSANSVAVMTPEKCALALRLAPSVFATCSLVVFDECQLLGDEGSARGPVAELVVTQLMLRSPKARLLLMSAIVQNPDDLAGWLADATKASAAPLTVRWRPTRTLRSVLGVENESFQGEAAKAKQELKDMSDRRKNLAFTARCALAACLQGAWQSTEEADYGIVSIDCDADLSVKRTQGTNGWRYGFDTNSWVNGTAINLATLFAEKGIQTLVFTPANRHYPFSNGGKVSLAPDVVTSQDSWPPEISTYGVLAEYELGCASVVFELFQHGVAVHTSSMLEVEKIASEMIFKRKHVPLMFATGTLAQGLNLPAIAVIIAGTRIGDPRGEDADLVQRRKFSQLLNAAGRAGRAGFANQGIVIAIPDSAPLLGDFRRTLEARNEADFLQAADDAVIVGSGLDRFLDDVCTEVLNAFEATDLDLQVVALLTGGDGNQLEAEQVLRRSYAAFRRKQSGKQKMTHDNAERLKEVRDIFIQEAKAPEWITIAAQRAGLDFFLTLAISTAWGRHRRELPHEYAQWSVTEWLGEFLEVASLIPPHLLERILSRDQLAKVSQQFKMLKEQNPEVFLERNSDWDPPDAWSAGWDDLRAPLTGWMSGESIVTIAAILTGKSEKSIPADRTSGKPIPRALSVTMDVWSSLALVAGGFLAVAEQVLEGKIPLPLACLPMSIKYGCDSPGTLAWF